MDFVRESFLPWKILQSRCLSDQLKYFKIFEQMHFSPRYENKEILSNLWKNSLYYENKFQQASIELLCNGELIFLLILTFLEK